MYMKKTFNFVKRHVQKIIVEIVAIVFTVLCCILNFTFQYYRNSDDFWNKLEYAESQLSNADFEDPHHHLFSIQSTMLDMGCVAGNKSYYGVAYTATNKNGDLITSSRNVRLMLWTDINYDDFNYYYLDEYFSAAAIDDFLEFQSDLDCPDGDYRNMAVEQSVQKMEGYYDESLHFIPFSITFENTYYDGSYTLINEDAMDDVAKNNIVTYEYSSYNDDFVNVVVFDSTESASQTAWKNLAYNEANPKDIGIRMSGSTETYDYKLYVYADAIGYTLHSSIFIWSCIAIFLVLQVISIVTIAISSYIRKRNRMLAEMKGLFLDAIAHEMKTPIATSVNCIECIRSNVNPDKNDHYLSIINDESLRLNSLLESMLTYTRISESGYRIEKKDISMIKAIRQAASHFSSIIEQKNIEICYDIISDFQIVGDLKLIDMVLDNYLSNATKNCNENGKLKISIDDKSLSVFNEGKHIKNENLDKIWEPLFKEDVSRSEDSSGAEESGSVGMGLAISAEILKHHNLTYGAENSEGGVTFYIRRE